MAYSGTEIKKQNRSLDLLIDVECGMLQGEGRSVMGIG